MLAVVALAANYGPVSHYREARARLQSTAAEIAVLEQQKAALESQLDNFGQAGYLEGLARQELTYARPDEDLYIVAGITGAAGASASVSTAVLGIGASLPGADYAEIDPAGRPGFLERILSAISGIF